MATTTTVTASPRAAPALSRDGGESRPSPSRPIPSRSSTSAASPIGFLGNLTPQQHIKLKQLWRILLQYWDPNTTVPDVETCSVASTSQTTKSTRQRMLALTRSQNHQPSKRIVIPPQILLTLKSLGASSSDIRACRSFLVKLPCEQVCPAFLAMLRHENPDALMLRFLREEKWNVVKAWIALLHVLNWRTNTIKVDEILMKGEEAAFLKSRMLEECADKKYGEGFMLQLTTGKGLYRFLYRDIRLVMTPPTETVLVIFDMASFSITNWDFPPIKFIIDCFQDNYPGLLGHVLLYNAPKIFAGFWKIIQGVLSPELAEKVKFVRGVKNLERWIPRERILGELGGEEDWAWEYINPFPDENHRLTDQTTRTQLLDERRSLGDYLFCLTAEWVATSRDDSLRSHRDEVFRRLGENYWRLDPYIRARNISDRTGVIQEGGKLDYYPLGEKLIRAKAKPKILAWNVNGMNLSTVTTINGRRV